MFQRAAIVAGCKQTGAIDPETIAQRVDPFAKMPLREPPARRAALIAGGQRVCGEAALHDRQAGRL
jgi:hypothetical protein